jgi:hypothetical protein
MGLASPREKRTPLFATVLGTDKCVRATVRILPRGWYPRIVKIALLAALLVAAPLIVGCQTMHIGSSSCVGLDDRDCRAAESTAKLAAPSGYGPTKSIDINRDWEGCFLIICERTRATVTITYHNTSDVVTVYVERGEGVLGSMEATRMDVRRSGD